MTGNEALMAIFDRGLEPTEMHKISDTEYEVLALDGGYEPVRYRVREVDGRIEVYVR